MKDSSCLLSAFRSPCWLISNAPHRHTLQPSGSKVQHLQNSTHSASQSCCEGCFQGNGCFQGQRRLHGRGSPFRSKKTSQSQGRCRLLPFGILWVAENLKSLPRGPQELVHLRAWTSWYFLLHVGLVQKFQRIPPINLMGFILVCSPDNSCFLCCSYMCLGYPHMFRGMLLYTPHMFLYSLRFPLGYNPDIVF